MSSEAVLPVARIFRLATNAPETRNYMRAFEFTAEHQLESKTVLNMSHRLLYPLARDSRARGTREFDPVQAPATDWKQFPIRAGRLFYRVLGDLREEAVRVARPSWGRRP